MALQVVHTSEANCHPFGWVVLAYVGEWMRNPVRGSNFDKMTWWWRWLPMSVVLKIMFAAGYEGLLFIDTKGAVVGHVFYQRHGNSLHAFHWFIQEDERGRGHMHEISETFFERAKRNPHITKIRIGAGGNERIARMWELIRDGKIVPECGLEAGDEMGWLIFPDRVRAEHG